MQEDAFASIGPTPRPAWPGGGIGRWPILIFLWASAFGCPAVLFYSTGAPDFNTNAPPEALADSGWLFQGQWGAFLGTPIAPHFFITGKHLGGAVGQLFAFAGISYSTTAIFDDAESDLRLCSVQQAFPRFAPLYEQSDEIGQSVMVYGRGTQRGDPVYLSRGGRNPLIGWYWGAADGLLRWGQSEVDSLETNAPGNPYLLKMLFRSDRGPNEADLSGGDSGGGLFVQSGTGWKLAGINYAVSGPYNTNNVGDGFNAALFDERGLYGLNETNTWELIPVLSSGPQPGSFYATRISARLAWINQTLAQAGPPSGTVLLGADRVTGPYQEDPNASIDPVARTITISPPSSTRFWKVQDSVVRTITDIVDRDRSLVITFQ
jgi:hypothetical protein